MKFLDLKNQLRDELFAGNEQENLVAAHNNFFQQAMYDLQRAVPCYRFGNKDVYPHCATYFECGLTVIPAPRGEIVEVYTIDKINPTTGLEDATAADDWCSKVFYNPVRFCEMERFRCLCERVATANMLSVAESIASLWWGIYRNKHAYPRPTDEGLEAQPILNEGRHYPQASTNAGGRSPGGRFAIERGRLYIAPWIESTESLVVKWNGIKRKWSDDDFVDDDPKVLQAIRLNVAIQHYIAYEDNPTKLAELKEQYGNPDRGQWGAIQDLIDECRRDTEAVACRQAGSSASAARGFGPSNEFSYWNNLRVERTATCPAGQTGTAKTVVKEIGSVGSHTSVDDANSRAALEAFNEATALLVCVTAVVTHYSLAVMGSASCPGAQSDGTPAAVNTPPGPVFAPLPAGYATSPDSIEAATAIAQTAADALAAQQLVCTFYNKAAVGAYSCPDGEIQAGDDGAATVPASTYSGASQSLANTLAINEAARLAKAAFITAGGTCNGTTPGTFLSTAQEVGPQDKACQKVVVVSGAAHIVHWTIRATVTVSAGNSTGASVEAANNQARANGYNYLNAVLNTPTACLGGGSMEGQVIERHFTI